MSKESGGLSREEFLIVQEQLIELRNKNYELQEELKRKQNEINSMSTAQTPKNEALQFASKLMNRGKEKEVLQQRHDHEIDQLQLKLASQEQEFRLQQETLLTEINRVVSLNSDLERQMERLTAQPHQIPSQESTSSENDWTSARGDTLDSPDSDENCQERLEERVSLLEKENLELRETTQVKESELEQKNVIYEECLARLQSSIKNGEELDAIVRALENQLLDCKEKIKKDAATLDEKSSVVESLQQELARCRSKVSELEADSQLLRSELDETKQCKSQNQTDTEALRHKIGELEEKIKESKMRKDKLSEESTMLTDKLESAHKSQEDLQVEKLSMEEQLTSKEILIEELREKLREQEKEMEQTRSNCQTEVSGLREQLEGVDEKYSTELQKEKSCWTETKTELESRISELETRGSKDLEDRVLLMDTRYQLELSDREKQYSSEKEELLRKISALEEVVACKDEEKNLALKKQAAVLKELQRAVREERKRADSIEKTRGEREGWHVVDSDVRSNHTFDGNDSVSSVSALESDNAELITRLSTMHRTHAETTERLIQLESDNSRLQREVLEKNELIEHWIRCRPSSSQGSTPHRQETGGVFRKLLSTTLPVNESTNDIKEMNKKLQRMLEETLSKNILLQRDLQTLLERTEM